VRPIAFSTIYSRWSHLCTARLLQTFSLGQYVHARANIRANTHTNTHTHTHTHTHTYARARGACVFVLFSLENGGTGLNNSCVYTRVSGYRITSKIFIFLMRKVVASWLLSAQNMFRVLRDDKNGV
jgi:hypothetical protein